MSYKGKVSKKIVQAYLQNDQDEETRDMFIEWYDMNSNEKQKEKAFYDHWKELSVDNQESVNAEYELFLSKVKNNGRGATRRRLVFIGLKYASIFIMAFISGYLFYRLSSESSTRSDTQWLECYAPPTGIKKVVLSDSTIVTLNSGSVLLYPKEFNQVSRDVYLNGEAYFEVKKDKQKKFHVKTSDIHIEVLGTSFNVEAYSESNLHIVSLKEGKVSLYNRLDSFTNESVTLLENQQYILDRTNHKFEHKNRILIEDVIAWMNNQLIFDNENLTEVLAHVERKFGVDIILQTNKFNQDKVTIKLKNNESITDFFHILTSIIPSMQYSIRNNKVYIN